MTITLVTGGGSGIGAEVCRAIAAPGQEIFVHTGANRKNAEAVAAEIEAAGARAHVLVADFIDPHRAGEVIGAVREEAGGLDQLVHLAGYSERKKFGELIEAAFEASLSTNARAFFHLASAALPLLRGAKAARVVTAGSFVAEVFRLDRDFPQRQRQRRRSWP